MNGLKFTLQVLKDYGYEIPQINRNICCLFHEETRPSARLYETGSYHCWSGKCGAHFSDGLGAIMQIEGCHYKDALTIAGNRYGFQVPEKDMVSMKEFYSLEEAIVKKVIEQKPMLFLSVYKTLDTIISERDLDKMKKLYTKLSQGEIK